MRKLFCIVVMLLVSVNFAIAQDDIYDFGYRGLHSLYGLDGYYDFNSSGYGITNLVFWYFSDLRDTYYL